MAITIDYSTSMATETTQTLPTIETVLVNGTEYVVLSRNGDVLTVCRPNGVKTYTVKRVPDSELYGNNRGRMVMASAMPWSR